MELCLVPAAKKTFVAFANTDGGTVLIGVDDNGNTIGLEDPDKILLQVVNTIRDTIQPDIAQSRMALRTSAPRQPSSAIPAK